MRVVEIECGDFCSLKEFQRDMIEVFIGLGILRKLGDTPRKVGDFKRVPVRCYS